MVALIGGLAALLLGLIGLIAWWTEFLWLLQGTVPVILILGGALAAYLGSEELKDKRRAEAEVNQAPFAPAQAESVDQYKQEVEELKAKLAAMEKEGAAGEAGEATGEEFKQEDKAE